MTNSGEPVCLLTEDEIVASLQNTANLLSARRVLLEAAQFLDNTNRTAQHFNLTTQVDNYEQAAKEYEQTTETTVMLQHFTKTVDQSIILNHVLREDLNSSSASSQSQVKVLFNSNQLEGLITHLNDNEGAEKEANMKCNIENKMKISETLPRLRNLFVKTEKDEEKIERFNTVNKYLKKMEIMRNVTQRLLANCSWKEVASDPKLREIHMRTLKRKTLADYYRQSEVIEVIMDTSRVSAVNIEEHLEENDDPVEDDEELIRHAAESNESRTDPPGAILGNSSASGKTRNASFRSRVSQDNTTIKSERNNTFRSGLLDGTRTTRNEVSGIARLNLNDTESFVKDDSLDGSAASYEQNQSLNESVQSQNESVGPSEISLGQSEENLEQSVISSRIANRSRVSRLEDSVEHESQEYEQSINESRDDESLEEIEKENKSLYQSVDESSEDEPSYNQSTPEGSRVRSRNFGNTSRISAHSSRKRGTTLPERRSPLREERMETSSDEEYYEASEDVGSEKRDEEEEVEDDEEAIEEYEEENEEEVENEEYEGEEDEEIDNEEDEEEIQYEEENEILETESVENEGREENVDDAEPNEEQEELDYDEIEDEEQVVDNQASLDESYEEMDGDTQDEQTEEMADETYEDSFENNSNDSIMTSISQMPENEVWAPAGPYQAPLGYVPPVYAAPCSGAMNPIFGYRPSMGAPPLINYRYIQQYEAYDEYGEEIEYEEDIEYEEEVENEEEYDMPEEETKVKNPKKVSKKQEQKVQEKGKKKVTQKNKVQKKVLQEKQPTQPSKTRRKR